MKHIVSIKPQQDLETTGEDPRDLLSPKHGSDAVCASFTKSLDIPNNSPKSSELSVLSLMNFDFRAMCNLKGVHKCILSMLSAPPLAVLLLPEAL